VQQLLAVGPVNQDADAEHGENPRQSVGDIERGDSDRVVRQRRGKQRDRHERDAVREIGRRVPGPDPAVLDAKSHRCVNS
jgi:hypothetical protein